MQLATLATLTFVGNRFSISDFSGVELSAASVDCAILSGLNVYVASVYVPYSRPYYNG